MPNMQQVWVRGFIDSILKEKVAHLKDSHGYFLSYDYYLYLLFWMNFQKVGFHSKEFKNIVERSSV